MTKSFPTLDLFMNTMKRFAKMLVDPSIPYVKFPYYSLEFLWNAHIIMAFHLNVPKVSCINPSFISFRKICLALNLTKSTYSRYGRWLWLGLELICVHACQLTPRLDPYITMLLIFFQQDSMFGGKLISCTTEML